MAEEDLTSLGFGEKREYVRKQSDEGVKESNGFIAGTGVRPSKKYGWFG